MVEFPFEFTRTFPELNRIGIVGGEESPKVTENSGGVGVIPDSRLLMVDFILFLLFTLFYFTLLFPF